MNFHLRLPFVCYSTTHRELFVKLLGADKNEFAEGCEERTGQLRKGAGSRIATEEEIEEELLTGGYASDKAAAVRRKTSGDRRVRTRSCGCERGNLRMRGKNRVRG